jgi:hypothetical protein
MCLDQGMVGDGTIPELGLFGWESEGTGSSSHLTRGIFLRCGMSLSLRFERTDSFPFFPCVRAGEEEQECLLRAQVFRQALGSALTRVGNTSSGFGTGTGMHKREMTSGLGEWPSVKGTRCKTASRATSG